MATGAEQLGAAVRRALRVTGAPKVNIIAHSKGGLEARLFIAQGGAQLVASLVTVCTPHRGSDAASALLESRLVSSRAGRWTVEAFARLAMGDRATDLMASLADLRPEACARFNAAVPDSSLVYYRSYASVIHGGRPRPLIGFVYRCLCEREGPNDGLVSVVSAIWGDYHGIIGEAEGLSINHDEVHGICPPWRRPAFDAPAFYVGIVRDLEAMGL